MNIKLQFLSSKKELSQNDEDYLASMLLKQKISPETLVTRFKAASAKLKEIAYLTCEDEESRKIVIENTSKSDIKKINNDEYIIDLIKYRPENFDAINFSKYRQPENEYAYAKIILVYEQQLNGLLGELKLRKKHAFNVNDIEINTRISDLESRINLMLENFELARKIVEEHEDKPSIQDEELNA